VAGVGWHAGGAAGPQSANLEAIPELFRTTEDPLAVSQIGGHRLLSNSLSRDFLQFTFISPVFFQVAFQFGVVSKRFLPGFLCQSMLMKDSICGTDEAGTCSKTGTSL
jgi:hypothetical protein